MWQNQSQTNLQSTPQRKPFSSPQVEYLYKCTDISNQVQVNQRAEKMA
jgi:hypothetical protein